MADLADQIYRRLLVIRCQAGDPAARQELVLLCHPRLRAFLHKMLGQPQKVDDLAQDVWIDVFAGLSRLRDADAFLPWFYRIARNRVFRLLRKTPAPAEPLHEAMAAIDPDPDPRFTAAEAAAVHAALDELSHEHREVLLLRFMEDMSYDQIALVAACPVGTVRSRIFTAKRALRQIIERQASHDPG